MTGDLDILLNGLPIAPPTLNVTTPRRCRRHQWMLNWSAATICARCGIVRDTAKSRRGASSRRLGGNQERRIERVYGPRKVGEFGDPVDHLGVTWKWQSKATRADPPAWLAAILEPTHRAKLPTYITDPMQRMNGIANHLRPVVIRSFVHQGKPVRDWMFISAVDYGDRRAGYYAIPGDSWLALYGRDEA